MRKNSSTLKRVVFITAFLIIAAQSIFAQQLPPHTIEVIISNEKREPLQGAVVHERSTNESVVADASGKFKISIFQGV
ncbi:MAG: hypothetical protein ABI594_07905 [Ginsengibacter sp.]